MHYEIKIASSGLQNLPCHAFKIKKNFIHFDLNPLSADDKPSNVLKRPEKNVRSHFGSLFYY